MYFFSFTILFIGDFLMITLKLSSPTNSPEGSAAKLLLSTKELLSLISFTGIAHSGSKHSLIIKGSEQELITWLEMTEDYLGDEIKIITVKSIFLIKNRKSDIVDFWS
jgi:hypothetical protein